MPLNGRLSGEWQVEGTVADPQGSGQLALDDTRVLDREIGRVSTRLTLADHQLRATVALADLFTTGTATLAIASPRPRSGSSVPEVCARWLCHRHADDGCGPRDAGLATARGGRAPVTGQTSFAAHVEGVRHRHRARAHDGQPPAARRRRRRRARAIDRTGPRELRRSHARRHRGGIRHRSRRPKSIARRGSAWRRRSRNARRVARRTGRRSPAARVGRSLQPGSVLAGLQVDGRVRVDARAPGSLDRPALDAEASVDEGRMALAGPAASVHVHACARRTATGVLTAVAARRDVAGRHRVGDRRHPDRARRTRMPPSGSARRGHSRRAPGSRLRSRGGCGRASIR